MTGLQLGRRAAAAVIAVLMASPLRRARAQGQSRDQGQAGGQREGGSPSAGGRPSSMIWARNETEFAQALQSGADENWVPMFDPRTRVTLTRTITVRQTKHDGTVWGANGNFAKIKWAGPGGHDMIVYRGVKGVFNRGLYLETSTPATAPTASSCRARSSRACARTCMARTI